MRMMMAMVMPMAVMVLIRMLMLMAFAVGFVIRVVMVVYVTGMISLAPFNRISILICLKITALKEIIDNKYTPGPQSLLQAPCSMDNIFKVMEPEAHRC